MSSILVIVKTKHKPLEIWTCLSFITIVCSQWLLRISNYHFQRIQAEVGPMKNYKIWKKIGLLHARVFHRSIQVTVSSVIVALWLLHFNLKL